MIGYIKVYLISLFIFLIIDTVWLGVIAKNLYREQIGFILKDNFNLTAAAIFYLFFIAGLVFFVIDRALVLESWKFALFAGMFFGAITYATYDITNLAVLEGWPVFVTVVDIIWGMLLCGATSLITYMMLRI